MANKKIKCSVKNCEYHDSKEDYCDLKEIEVCCTCKECECKNDCDTACKSFKCAKEKIED